MEILAEFNDDKGLNVKLTKDKIYVKALGAEETFALRSVNGVGTYDNLEKYEVQLKEYNSKKTMPIFGYGLCALGLYLFFSMAKDDVSSALIEGAIVVGVGVMLITMGGKEPEVESSFRLMLSGGSRDFKFHKSDASSVNIANFINKIEETLTAYNDN